MSRKAIVFDEDEPLITSLSDTRTSSKKSSLSRDLWTKPALFALGIFVLLLFVAFVRTFAALSVRTQPRFKPTTPYIPIADSIKQAWAQYSPHYPVSDYVDPPESCTITQVNVLQRHGARFPTAGHGNRIQAALAKLQEVPHYKDPRLDFLKIYTYELGDSDLIRFGAAEAFDSGQLDFIRYDTLVGKSKLPFVRASGAPRVILSATNWTAGFAYASNGKFRPSLNVILQESLNDTLDDHMCPNAGGEDAEADEWEYIYATPIASFLNGAAPGANLTASDVSNLIALCPFDTLYKEAPTPFCGLFSQGDFDGFHYYSDLGKYYRTGYGNELGPVQGVGYVNELLARLTGSPVRDHTQTNRTLDADPATFPLDRPLYADFSHDNEMAAIFSALGLVRPARPLDPRAPDPSRPWVTSRLFPFSGRLVTERLECGGGAYVRMFVNDALQDLEFCGADGDGMCKLEAFVESQAYARNDGDGDFEKCFMEMTGA